MWTSFAQASLDLLTAGGDADGAVLAVALIWLFGKGRFETCPYVFKAQWVRGMRSSRQSQSLPPQGDACRGICHTGTGRKAAEAGALVGDGDV